MGPKNARPVCGALSLAMAGLSVFVGYLSVTSGFDNPVFAILFISASVLGIGLGAVGIFRKEHLPWLPALGLALSLSIGASVGAAVLALSSSLGWERMEAPNVPSKEGMTTVESFIATNGWDMPSSPMRDFLYSAGKLQTLHGLPWKRLRNEYPALTHHGILYVALEGWHHDVIGVAYNPKTNAFVAEITGFKPVGDHWYVWTIVGDEDLKLTKKYEGAR